MGPEVGKMTLRAQMLELPGHHTMRSVVKFQQLLEEYTHNILRPCVGLCSKISAGRQGTDLLATRFWPQIVQSHGGAGLARMGRQSGDGVATC